MQYNKHYTAPRKLLEIMKDRGLDVSDVSDAESLLKSIGYYRLTGYLYPFLKSPKHEQLFKNGSSLGQAQKLYEFDRKLRLMVFDQIERIEVAVRSAIVNITCAETDNVFWMTSAEYFASADKSARLKFFLIKNFKTAKRILLLISRTHTKMNIRHHGC